MKRFFFALLRSTRVISVIAWLNRKRVPILCYHSVTDGAEAVQPDPHKQHIPLPLFLQHRDYLKKKHNVVSLPEFQKGAAFLPMRHPFPTLGTTSEELFAQMLPDAYGYLDASANRSVWESNDFFVQRWPRRSPD